MHLNDNVQELIQQDERRYKKFRDEAEKHRAYAIWLGTFLLYSFNLTMAHFVERAYLPDDLWSAGVDMSHTVTMVIYPIFVTAFFVKQVKKSRKLYRTARIVKTRIEAQKPRILLLTDD